jgi:methionyl-tRNA synthetase
MVEVKTIKDIDNKTWNEFKDFAAVNNMKLGAFFKTLVKEHEKNTKEFWKSILECEKVLTDDEAEDMEKIIKNSRKDYGFRK